MTDRKDPWVVGLATLLAMVNNATVSGFRQSVLVDGLILRREGLPNLEGQELFDTFKHYCMDTREEGIQ